MAFMKYLFTYILFILFTASLLADTTEKKDSVYIPLYPLTEHESYQGGEYLSFTLNYGFVTGGKGYFTVNDTVIHNKKLFHIVGRGETTGLADVIFKVRDRYESYVDPATNLPIKSIRNIREGRYRYYNEVTYDRDSSIVTSQKSGTHKVQDGILDIIAAFYYARNHKFNDNMTKGEVIEFMTYFSDEPFPLRIKYKGVEKIKTKYGHIECYKFSPVTEVGRAFETEDDMQVWITKDKNRIPVKIKFELKVGSFTCEIDGFKGLKHPFESIIIE